MHGRSGAARTLRALLTALTLSIITVPQALADGCEGDVIPGEFIVKLRSKSGEQSSASTTRRLGRVVSAMGGQEVLARYDRLVPGLARVKALGLSAQQLRSAVLDEEVEFIEPNRCLRINDVVPGGDGPMSPIRIQATPNDPSYGSLWGLNNTGQSGGTADIDIDAPEAWDFSTGSASVVVGVVDTGIQYNHPDLAANMWTNPGEIAANGVDDDGNGVIDDVHGYNAQAENGDPRDDNGHGTHVAGTIGAVGNNSAGVVGVNWNVKLMALRFLGANGSGSLADAIAALQYAVVMKNRGVNLRVLNNSWGGSPPGPSLEAAIEATADAGIVFVAAAGNESNDNDVIPLSPGNVRLPNVISVAALTRTGALASFSNFGATTVDVAAPGVSIVSTYPTSAYATLSGTSMACPHVAGAAALLAAHQPQLSPADIRSRLLDTAKPLQNLNGLMISPGIISAFNALTEGQGGSCEPGDEDAPTIGAGDNDKDGIPGSVENADDTDDNDSGSGREHITSPVFSFWTGFLGIQQYLELVNTGDTDVVADVSLYSITGQRLSRTRFDVFARRQRDIDVNLLSGFTSESYGLLKITFCGGTLDGRISFYRRTAGSASGNHDFAYTVPLANPRYGASAVSYNTYQPSVAEGETSDLVANWHSVINLATATKGFTVKKYDIDGDLLTSVHIDVPSLGRSDLEAGHQIPGPNNVGLITVTPDDPDSPYISFLARYGYNAPPGESATALNFAFPLNALAPTNRTITVTVTTTIGAQNWLEVLNPTAQAVDYTLSFRKQSGEIVGPIGGVLQPFSQEHFNVNALIGSNEVGYAELKPLGSGKLLAQSMVYIRDAAGRISAMYGSQAREALLADLNGSYNLFLGMYNWLKITNPADSALSGTLTLYTPAGVVNRSFEVPARGSRDLGLHETTTYGTAVNSYGPFVLTFPAGRKVQSELLRLRIDPSTGAVDFAAPTAVR